MKFPQTYVDRVLGPEVGTLTPDTPLLWSRWPGRGGARRVMPIHGKNIKHQQNQIGGPNGTRANLQNSSARYHCALISSTPSSSSPYWSNASRVRNPGKSPRILG
jgi:hypothetical protein